MASEAGTAACSARWEPRRSCSAPDRHTDRRTDKGSLVRSTLTGPLHPSRVRAVNPPVLPCNQRQERNNESLPMFEEKSSGGLAQLAVFVRKCPAGEAAGLKRGEEERSLEKSLEHNQAKRNNIPYFRPQIPK